MGLIGPMVSTGLGPTVTRSAPLEGAAEVAGRSVKVVAVFRGDLHAAAFAVVANRNLAELVGIVGLHPQTKGARVQLPGGAADLTRALVQDRRIRDHQIRAVLIISIDDEHLEFEAAIAPPLEATFQSQICVSV